MENTRTAGVIAFNHRRKHSHDLEIAGHTIAAGPFQVGDRPVLLYIGQLHNVTAQMHNHNLACVKPGAGVDELDLWDLQHAIQCALSTAISLEAH